MYKTPLFHLAFVQEMGRARQDGKAVFSCVYYNASDISNAKKGMSADIRKYCLTNDCRRQVLADYFGYQFHRTSVNHNCCDNCTKVCRCKSCSHDITVWKMSWSNAYQISMQINLALLLQYYFAYFIISYGLFCKLTREC